MTSPAQKAETGFTAGIWRRASPNMVVGPNGVPIAHILTTVVGTSVPLPHEANARLIAAAPDLYVALNECRLWLEDNQPMPTARMWELAAKVRGAIAQAEGRP